MTIFFEDVSQYLDYDSESGVLTWRVAVNARGGKKRPGDVAGHSAENGYVLIGLKGRVYRAHRLAWLCVNKIWPKGFIDHIDGNRSNNAIKNLREATVAQNAQNMHKAHSDNVTGLLGVTKHGQCRRFAATICSNGKKKHLGLFKTAEEAHQAYLAAKTAEHTTWKINSR